MEKLTEDQVIEHLSEWLEKDNWKIIERHLGHTHGIDIKAEKNNKLLIVEAKGSRGNPNSHVTTRSKFDCGQIKDHFGKALVKVLEQRHLNPSAIVAIAQPDDPNIHHCLRDVIPETVKLNIRLYWVSENQVTQV